MFGTPFGSDLNISAHWENLELLTGNLRWDTLEEVSGTSLEQGFLCLSFLIWVCQFKGSKNCLLSGAFFLLGSFLFAHLMICILTMDLTRN